MVEGKKETDERKATRSKKGPARKREGKGKFLGKRNKNKINVEVQRF